MRYKNNPLTKQDIEQNTAIYQFINYLHNQKEKVDFDHTKDLYSCLSDIGSPFYQDEVKDGYLSISEYTKKYCISDSLQIYLRKE